jgi:hypothetical protein
MNIFLAVVELFHKDAQPGGSKRNKSVRQYARKLLRESFPSVCVKASKTNVSAEPLLPAS